MWTITRRVPSPQLRLLPGAIACHHHDRVTLYPMVYTAPVELTLSCLPEEGHRVLLDEGGGAVRLIARYDSAREARRQFHRLVGQRPGRWLDGLGRGALALVLVFLVWFLFVLPADPAYQTAALPEQGNAGPSARLDSAPTAALPNAVPAPAWIDDPAAAGAAP